MDELAFTDWLAELLRRHGDRLYRVKGICMFSGVDGRSLVQCVRGHAEVDRIDESLYPAEADPDNEPTTASMLVCIGELLLEGIKERIRAEFEQVPT